jgi:thymidylate synthase
MSYVYLSGANASLLAARVLETLCEENDGADAEVLWKEVAPRGQATRELTGCVYQLDDVTRCATWLPERRLNYAFMAAEFLWMFCGREDVAMISHYNERIKEFSDDGLGFFGAYGPRWRDQVGGAVHRLKGDLTSRQAVIGTWRPLYNRRRLTWDDESYFMETRDVPCTLSMQYLLRDGCLDAYVTMRSSDAWLGLPYDLFNFSMLQRAVAAELGVLPGTLTLFVGSSHLYERNLDQAREVLKAVEDHGSDLRYYLAIPGPPNLEHRAVMQAEESVRHGEMNLTHVAHLGGWVELLSLLDYRNHHDHQRVLSPYHALVTP